jgi:hypothetical protein
MKKLVIILAAAAVLCSAAGCATKSKAPENPNIPDFVLNPQNYETEGTILGIGSAKMSNVQNAITAAEARARQSIALTMNTAVQGMITDYAKEAGLNDSNATTAFFENVSRQLVDTRLVGAKVQQRVQTKDGAMWVLMTYNAADAIALMKQAADVAAAQEATFQAFDGVSRMEEALKAQKVRPVSE